MSSFPCLVRFVSGSGQVRYRLGERLVDRYLEFVAGRCRPNTLRAVAFDLKAFFADAQNRGYLDPSWYLLGIQSGFEIWNGGSGFASNSFMVDVQ